MNVILYGSTGMLGWGALTECLADPRVTRVLTVARRPTGVQHEKLEELIVTDFFDYEPVASRLAGYDACLFCHGVSSAGMSEAAYRHVTYDLTLAAARVLVSLNPAMAFCFVSGTGTDDTERGRLMWARVKGATENALKRLPFRAVYLFRPGYIQPVKGARSRTRLYRAFYTLLAPLYPLLNRVFPGRLTTTEAVGRALIEAALRGAPHQVLDNRAINALAAR
jgi:uncharacterized protein YbjT (DUF2867 family)